MTNKSAVKLLGILLVVFCGFLSTVNAAPGDLDTTFAGTGFYREAGNLGSADGIEATVIQSDGKIVSVGWVNYGDVFSCGISRHNSDGSLDTTFDGDGKTIVQIGIEFNCHDVAVQTDGKIVVVGYVRIGSVYNIAVFRYNSNGSPDTSFDGDGRKISAFVNGDFAYGVAIQTDGKIVVCGNIGDEFAVVRYNGDGSLDGTFDGDGWVATDFFGGPDHSRAIAIQADGKIVVAGNGRTASGSTLNDFAVARYNSDGSLDTSFDGDGKVLTDIQGNNDNVQEIAIQTDGKIVVGGSTWGNNDQFGLARYNPNGSLDTSFDGDGKLNSNITPFTELLYALAVQPDGKIIAAGVSSTFLLARYNPNGSLDTSFDGDGVLIAQMPYPFSAAKSVAVQTDGKIVAAGYSNGTSGESPADFALARFNLDGSFDASFDGDGKLVSNIHSWRISANAVAIQSDGKIVAAGKRYTLAGNSFNNQDFAVNRYNADGTLDNSFDGDGKVTTDVQGGDILHAIAIQPDGKIIVAGEGFNGLSMVRYNPNGSLDSSFGSGGLMVDGDNGSNRGTPFAVVVQPDGKILVAGQGYTFGPGYGSTVYRYNADGTRDNSFDGDGRVFTDLGGIDELSSMALQADGKIVVAGRAENGSSYDFTVMRYNSNGSLDASFDGDGVVTIDFVGGYDYVNALALQADGKIVVVGASSSDNNQQSINYDSALARLNPNGSLDTTFDGDGKIRVSLSNYFDTATGVAIQTDGKILTSGSTASLSNNDLGTLDNNFALVRYNSNGSFDNTYGINGKAINDLFIHDLANDLVLDSSGRAVIAGETDGYFTVARFLGGAAAPNVVAPFDFDGDGKSDISVFRPSNGQWWLNRSSAGVAAVQFGASSDKLTPGDFTGDGKTDIGFFRPSTGEWFVLRSEDGSFFAHPFGTNGDIPAPGDYDLDGKTDEAVFRPSTATWYINKSSGGIIIQQFGQTGDVPVVSDYDGDGKSDIAVYRVSAGEWWILRSTAGLIAFQFGNSSDKPVQGDYTGDGKADVALFRPATGEWFVLRSENQSYYSFGFGTNGDIPSPGDYDGDGKFDATVFRPSNSTWFVNKSTGGNLIQSFGQSGDVPVPNAFVP